MGPGKVVSLCMGLLKQLGVVNAAGVFTAIAPVPVDWTAYTPGCTWTSNVTVTGEYRVVDGGDTLELRINLTCSGAPGPGATALQFDLPAGYTARLPADGAKNTRLLGTGDIYDADAGSGQLGWMISHMALIDGNTFQAVNANEAAAGAADSAGITATNPITFAASDQINFALRIPLA